MTDQRTAERTRETKETSVSVKVNLDGTGGYDNATGVPFFDHMLDQLSRHSGIDLEITAKGDLEIDAHHTVEDVGIVLGMTLLEALGDAKGIQRYGNVSVPMEESLAEVSVDLCGRSNLIYNVPVTSERVGEFETQLAEEFFRALVANAKMTLHVNVPYGSNQHHILEAVFKGTARALKQAVARGKGGVPSTKGVL